MISTKCFGVSWLFPHNINHHLLCPSIYDHRVWKTGLPVRSAVLKPHAGWLVVGWVTTSESQLSYVSLFILIFDASYHAIQFVC